MMRKVRAWFVVILLAILAVFGTGAYMLSRGFSARDEPTAAEAFVARNLRHLATPRTAQKLVNPVTLDPEVLERATAHFADHCSSCHGNDGRGTTMIGRGLYPKPPDMTQRQTQDLTDGEIYYIIENGVRFTGMPAFGEAPGDQNSESWELVHFIRHLPAMTDDEIAAMKKMNPKSPAEIAREERMRRFLQGDDTQPAQTDHEHHH